MPTLASANLTQLAIKLEGIYPTNFGQPQGGNGELQNMTGESFSYDQGNEVSKTLRADRQVSDTIPVSISASGGFQFEHQYKEFDTLYQAVMQSAYVVYGTNGVSASIATLTLTSTTITAGAAPTGSDAFTTLKKGQWIKVKPPAGASQSVKDYLNGRVFQLHKTTAPTTTVLTLDAATPIDTAKAGTSLSNANICSSYVGTGSQISSYTVEVQHADIGQFRQYNGMVPSKMMIKLETGKIITGSFEFLGKGMAILNATSMGTAAASETYAPANSVRGVFDIFEGGASIRTNTFIKSMDFTIDNTLRVQDAVGVLGTAGIANGTMSVTANLEVYFADEVMYNKFINNTTSSLSLPILDVDGNGYVYYFPRIKYTAAKVNAGGQDQDNMLTMSMQALPDNVAGSPFLNMSVVIFRVGV